MGSDGADLERAHDRAMANLTSLHVPRRESMHAVVLEAFPSTRLDNMGLPCGVGSFKESGPSAVMGTGMYSGVRYTCFDVVRELALRILHRLVLDIVHDSERVRRGTVYVADVRRALRQLGFPQTLEMISDANTLPSCPSVSAIKKGPSGNKRKPGSERQSLIEEQSQKYKELLAQEAGNVPALGGERGASRRALIALHQGGPAPPCLYLPVKYFQLLTTWMFTGAEGHAVSLTPGAKALIQHGVEEAMMWVVSSAWQGLRGFTNRTALTGHDIVVMTDILRRNAERLRGDLPDYDGLDALDRLLLGEQQRAEGNRGRGRGRSAGSSSGGRAGQKRRPPSESDESDSASSSRSSAG